MCLTNRCLAMDVYIDFTIPDFGYHITILKEISQKYSMCAYGLVSFY
jgi:hypothetical protein